MEKVAVFQSQTHQSVFRKKLEVLVLKQDTALGCLEQTDQQLQEHALTATTFPDHHQGLSRRDLQIDAPEHLVGTQGDAGTFKPHSCWAVDLGEVSTAHDSPPLSS